MNTETIILVDLDNMQGTHVLNTICSFYTPKTKFVFFGIKADRNTRDHRVRAHPNNAQFKRLDDIFMLLKKHQVNITTNVLVPDGTDMKMFAYAGLNLSTWKNTGVKNIIIASRDNELFSLAVLLKGMFNVWIMHHQSIKGDGVVHQRRGSSRQLGIVIPEIRIKKGKS
jgi:hypothetical protein